jgi:hypothetical protein
LQRVSLAAEEPSFTDRVAVSWVLVLTIFSMLSAVLIALSSLPLALLATVIASDVSQGDDATWTPWLVMAAIGSAALVGILLTWRLPAVAYAFRILATLPFLIVAVISLWLLIPVALALAAHVSLMLSQWQWTLRTYLRWASAVGVAIVFGWLTLPLNEGRSCEDVHDPSSLCDIWYETALGIGNAEDRELLGGSVLAVVVGLIVGFGGARQGDDSQPKAGLLGV